MEKMKKRFDRAGQTRKGPALAEWALKGRLQGLAALAVSLCLALAVLPMPQAAAETAADKWDGTTKDTSWYDDSKSSFTLTTAAQLAGMRELMKSNTDFAGKAVTLAADLDLDNKEWGDVDWRLFKGEFDGGGHTVSNIAGGSIFGMVENGSVHSLRLKNVNISKTENSSGENGIGGLVRYLNGGAIYDCVVESGTLTLSEVSDSGNNDYVGGLVGWVKSGSVKNCASFASVSGATTSQYATNLGVGGLVGRMDGGTVENCYSTGTVTAAGPGGFASGGIVGKLASGSLAHCYWNSGAADAAGAGSPTECYKVTAEQAAGTGSAVIGVGSTYANTPSLTTALNNWVAAQGAGTCSAWRAKGGQPAMEAFLPEYLDVAGPLEETTHQSAGGSVNAGMDLEGQVQENVELLAVTIPAGIPFILDVDGTGALTRVLSATGRVTNRSDMAIDVTLASVSDDTQNPLLGKADLYLVPDPAPAGYTRAKLAAGSPNTALAAGLAKDAAVALTVEGDPKANAGLGMDGDTFTIATVLKVTKAA